MERELSMVISSPDGGEFLKRIDWNREEFMELVASMTREYEGLEYTEEQVKEAKEDRARLNAMKKAISDRRIEVKNAVMAPYTQFEKEVREIVSLIEQPVSLIDAQIKKYEERAKSEKRGKLEEYFNGIAGGLDGILTFGMVFDSRYLNASASIKKAEEDISAKVGRFRTDLRTIEAMCDGKYHTAVKDYYIKSMDISGALEEAGRLAELDRKLEGERERKAGKADASVNSRHGFSAGLPENVSEPAENVSEAAENVSKPLENVLRPAENVSEPAENVSEPEKSVPGCAGNVMEPEGNVQGNDKNACVPPVGGVAVPEPPAMQEDTKQYKASFTVYGTKAQIMGVKQYMVDNNIRFGKVERKHENL